MDQMNPAVQSETRRMELRGIVRLAGEVIGQYWPMPTFVHHNPFHSLEHLRFDETVRCGQNFLGGRGYLSGETYRAYLRSGRILLRHLDEALQPLAGDQSVVIGTCRMTHREVLRACLRHGLCMPADEPLDAVLDHRSNEELVKALADHLAPVLKAPTVEDQIATVVREDCAALGRSLTLSHWCDGTLGTQIVTLVNNELIKWCEAFLDEGHATWPMPGREQDSMRRGSLSQPANGPRAASRTVGRKITALPEHPEDAVLESLELLAIPEDLRQDYLSLQLTALPGWAGFIKWRAEAAELRLATGSPGQSGEIPRRPSLVHARVGPESLRRGTRHRRPLPRRVRLYAGSSTRRTFFERNGSPDGLPAVYAEQVERLSGNQNGKNGWSALADRLHRDFAPLRDRSLAACGRPQDSARSPRHWTSCRPRCSMALRRSG